MQPKLPEGYIAPRFNSSVYAFDSATLRKGEVHGSYVYKAIKEARGIKNPGNYLDTFVEFNINGDPRLDKLEQFADTLGERFPMPASNSPDYMVAVRKREKTITDRIMSAVYSTYGHYSDETAKRGPNAGEMKTKDPSSDGTAYLKDMEKGSLVCRHLAVIVGKLLDRSKVPNHVINSAGPVITFPYKKNKHDAHGKYEIIDGVDFRVVHMYIVTDIGNSIVEATTTDQYANGKSGSAYQPILNGVTTEDIVHFGHAALTEAGLLYGGHLGDGAIDPERTKKAKEYSLERYNAELENRNKRQQAQLPVASKWADDSGCKLLEERVFSEAAWLASQSVSGGEVQPESGKGEHVPPPKAIPNARWPHSPSENGLGSSQK